MRRPYIFRLEENNAIVRKVIEAFNKRNLALVDELTAPDFVEHTHLYKGREAHKQFLEMHIRGLPDFNMGIEDMIAEGDNVWVLFKVTGTHTGEFLGLAPTGKKTTFASVQIFRIVDGKLAECRAVSDSVEFRRQLGVIEYTEKTKKLFPQNIT